jgi:hypothetical protein
MSFASEASKLLTNKYFLYFIVFLASTNVLGYLVTHKFNAVAFFALVGFLTSQFSKNMTVILLVAVISTNFMMSNKMMREGLENRNTETRTLDNVDSKDPEIASTLPVVRKASSNEEVQAALKSRAEISGKSQQDIRSALQSRAESSGKSQEDVHSTIDAALSDVNNTDLNQKREDKNAPEGFGKKREKLSPARLDYAATIEQSYQNLDSILGSDSIKQLTTDTQKLMQQQQNLFNSMNQMVPVLESAKSMLSSFNIDDLQKSFKNVTGLGNAPTMVGAN